MKDDLVSIYIPSFNRPALLKRAVTSVLLQTYPHIEVVVANDGDELPQDLLDYLSQNDVIYLKTKGKEGACKARNMAIEVSKGKYITGLDDDDYFENSRIESFVKATTQHGDAIYFTGYTFLQGSVKKFRKPLFDNVSISEMLKKNYINNQVFAPKSYFVEAGGFDESLPAWQDFDMWIRMIKLFGDAKLIDTYDYVMDANTDVRISKNITAVCKAIDIFLLKHSEYQTNNCDKAYLFANKQNYPEAPLVLSEYLFMYKNLAPTLVTVLLLKKIIYKTLGLKL